MNHKIRTRVITAVIGAIVVGLVPTSIYLHNAWGDDRYVMTAENIRDQIRIIDHALFETDQEISFAETNRDKAKFEARKNYYLREKQALTEKLQAK